MNLASLTLRNYRSFAGPATLHLRPVTLIFGPNNVGKSSLLRALPLLADSVGNPGPDALNLKGRLSPFDLSFDTLRWRGDRASTGESIGLQLRWDDGPIRELSWEVWEQPEWRRMIVQHLVCTSADGTSTRLDWKPVRSEARARALTYQVPGGTAALRFNGLLTPEAGELPGALSQLRGPLTSLAESVLWLHTVRPAPPRRSSWSEGVRWVLRPDGSDAPIVLAGEPAIYREVQDWYRRGFGLDLLVEETAAREAGVQVQKLSGAGVRVDVADTGEGLGQVLSVLTALAMVRQHRERQGPSILAVEEPESHLHPTTQRTLAERICQVASTEGVRIVLETHSPYMLLAVQVCVASGLLPPEAVGIHWVQQGEGGESKVDLIELTEKARFKGNWPPDAFSEDLALAAELDRLRLGPTP